MIMNKCTICIYGHIHIMYELIAGLIFKVYLILRVQVTFPNSRYSVTTQLCKKVLIPLLNLFNAKKKKNLCTLAKHGKFFPSN